METKQVIVMRKDLNMRKGKIAAQAGHAVMWSLLDYSNISISESGDLYTYTITVHKKSSLPLDNWIFGDYKKICVSVNSEREIFDICEKAKEQGIPFHIQYDNGLTEFKGVKTVTCCAIGPGNSDIIDAITGHLPLL
jgi:PTH2 family peptidyl-tRNA hydrolase